MEQMTRIMPRMSRFDPHPRVRGRVRVRVRDRVRIILERGPFIQRTPLSIETGSIYIYIRYIVIS